MPIGHAAAETAQPQYAGAPSASQHRPHATLNPRSVDPAPGPRSCPL